jgi:serine/threonine protein kinase
LKISAECILFEYLKRFFRRADTHAQIALAKRAPARYTQRISAKEITLRVTAQEWLTLSPLIDVALDIAVTERRNWVDSLPDLSPELREKLYQLVAQHGAPETQNFLEALPSIESLKSVALPRDPNADGDWRADDIIGNYTLIHAIGHGGMGDVWLAKRSDGAYQRNVALKLPSPDAAPARIRERMLRERDVLASLEHANIARFYDAGVTASGQPYIAMEFVEGDTLSAYAESKKLSTRDRCKLFLQVLSAVQFAHQRLIVHRDLKPSNILVRNDGQNGGQVALLDFGIAKVLDEASHLGTESQLTRDTGRALTLAYAAPEQVLSEPISTATDIFSAGALFYELLSGTRPFAVHEKNMAAMIKAYDAPIKPMPNALGRDLNAIVARALRREPNDRYESAAAFADDIKRYLDDQPVVAVQGARWYSLGKFVRRQRVVLLLSSGGLATLCVASVIGFNQYQKAQLNSMQARSADELLTGLLAAVSPENARSRTFTAQDILDQSQKLLNNSADGEPQKYAARFARLYAQIGDDRSAERLYADELKRAESTRDVGAQARALLALAKLSIHPNRISTATEYLDRAERISSNVPDEMLKVDLNITRGRIAVANGRDGEALQYYDAADRAIASTSFPTTRLSAELRELMGHTALRLGQFVDAKKYYEQAAAIDATSNGRGEFARVNAVLNKMSIDEKMGFHARAIRAAEDALPQLKAVYGANSSFVWSCQMMYSNALFRSGDLDKASEIAELIVNETTGDSGALYKKGAKILLARIKMFRGDAAAAESVFASTHNKFAGQKPSIGEESIRRLLAESILRQGRTDEALAILRLSEERVVALLGERNVETATTRALMAVGLLRQGQVDIAQAMLQDAHDVIVKQIGAQHHVALTAEIYLQLIVSLKAHGGTELPRPLVAVQSWQPAANGLALWFTNAETRRTLSTLPIVF